jgi:hypothetical protein
MLHVLLTISSIYILTEHTLYFNYTWEQIFFQSFSNKQIDDINLTVTFILQELHP